MGDFVVTNEPGEILLKDAICESVAKFVDDGVESALGRGRLPTAIEDGDEIIAHLSDQVSMKANLRNAVLSRNGCVCFGPVGIALDSGVHLGFDLTHFETELNWFVWYVASIGPKGVSGDLRCSS